MEVNGRLVYKEIVEKEIDGWVLSSSFEVAKDEEFNKAKEQYLLTKTCKCVFFQDENIGIWDLRRCVVCGRGMGVL